MLDLKKTSREQKLELDEIKKSLGAYQKGISANKNAVGKDAASGQKNKGEETGE
jgi:hypothetical protein